MYVYMYKYGTWGDVMVLQSTSLLIVINRLLLWLLRTPFYKQVRAGIVGYPNVGKSSLINRLLTRRMCPAAPRPGVTRELKYKFLLLITQSSIRCNFHIKYELVKLVKFDCDV